MDYFVKISNEGVITDCVTFDATEQGYIHLDMTDVPTDILAGVYRLTNGEIVLDENLNQQRIEVVVQRAIDDYTLSLIEMGVL